MALRAQKYLTVRVVSAKLYQLANELDKHNFYEEADLLTKLAAKLSLCGSVDIQQGDRIKWRVPVIYTARSMNPEINAVVELVYPNGQTQQIFDKPERIEESIKMFVERTVNDFSYPRYVKVYPNPKDETAKPLWTPKPSTWSEDESEFETTHNLQPEESGIDFTPLRSEPEPANRFLQTTV